MATRLDERLKQVADEVTAKLASVGKSATRADVERKLRAIAPKEVPGSLILAMALEDSERANAELQRKIAELQATRSLPSVPIDRDASARRAGHGGGTVYATYASSSIRADEGDDYDMRPMRASANAKDDAYEVPMNAEDDTYGIDSDSSSIDHAYQNTTYEAMSAFLSDLPVLDRSGAEKVLREDGVDGTFVLRRKAGTDSTGVVSCLSRGKIEHHILNLKENREKNGAVWVSKQTALDEISMVEAASGLLLDKHVRHPKWLQSKATFT